MQWKTASPNMKRREVLQLKQLAAAPLNPELLPYLDYAHEYESTEMILRRFQALDEFERHQHNQQDEHEDEEEELYFHSGGNRQKRQPEDRSMNSRTADHTTSNLHASPSPYDFDEYELYNHSTDDESWSNGNEYDEFEPRRKRSVSARPDKKIASSHPTPSDSKIPTKRPPSVKSRVIDLDASTLVKLPPCPIPATWANLIQNPLVANCDGWMLQNEVRTSSILRNEDDNWIGALNGRKFQGILMQPPLDSLQFTPFKLAKRLKPVLPRIMKDGYLFIWVEREHLAATIRSMEQHLSFKYVENLCWIWKDLGNRTVLKEKTISDGRGGGATTAALFHRSKLTLLILRRDPNNTVKLRHQRNADCIFDFYAEDLNFTRTPDRKVYDVIETLLDGGNSGNLANTAAKTTANAVIPHLLHLWADGSPTASLLHRSRNQWTRVIEQQHEEKESPVNSVPPTVDEFSSETFSSFLASD